MTESPIKIPEEIAKLSFEEALDELRALVSSVERGDAKLDDAIQAYATGSALRQHCQNKLAEAKAKIEQLTFGPDGTPNGTEPFEI
ncbi:MAG: exodeoxyribonuclease VII small subunit [Alphaproteobacteria bacterium]